MVALVAIAAGCSRDTRMHANGHSPAAPAVVRLLVADDPTLTATLQGIAGDWKAQSGTALQVAAITDAELSTTEKLDADAIIYPPQCLGALAERHLIRPLNGAWLSGNPLEADDLLTPPDSPELSWDGRQFAIPLGEPVLLLFYRDDVLARFGKTPPRTWEEYQHLAEEISREHRLRATAEPLARGWASRILLARAAAYARHRDYLSVLFNRETLEPLIAGPPFVKALEEMAKTARLNSDGATELTPQQSVALVLSGKAAMAIGFLDRRTKGSPMNSIGIAELPGSDSAYHLGHAAWERRRSGEANQVTLRGIGGRVGSVVRGSEEAENAFMLLAWLSSKQTSQEIMSADVDFAPFRFSQLANSAAWISASLNPVEVNEYVKTFTAVLSRKEVLWVPRIPGANDYLAALDDAVRLAMTGEKTTQQALDSAAEQWRQITARYGVQQQLEAYRHSLKLPK